MYKNRIYLFDIYHKPLYLLLKISKFFDIIFPTSEKKIFLFFS